MSKLIKFLDGNKILEEEHLFIKGEKLRNKKTQKIVTFDSYYIVGMIKYDNDNQKGHIGWIERFEKV